MNAETITVSITIRPSYAKADRVKESVEDMLEYLMSAHNALTYEWLENGVGEWAEEYDQTHLPRQY